LYTVWYVTAVDVEEEYEVVGTQLNCSKTPVKVMSLAVGSGVGATEGLLDGNGVGARLE